MSRRGKVEEPARNTVCAGVRARGKGCPISGRPYRHGRVGFTDNAGIRQLLQVRQQSLCGEPLVHGKHHAVQANDVDAFRLLRHVSHSLSIQLSRCHVNSTCISD